VRTAVDVIDGGGQIKAGHSAVIPVNAQLLTANVQISEVCS
jgi:hypothetical protein